MSETTKKDRQGMHLLITLVIMLAFRFIPPPGSVTAYGMAVLGVFIGLIYGWTFIGLLIPSLVGAVMLATTGYGSVEKVFIAMFSNSTVLMMLVGVLVFFAIQQSGAGDWLIAKILSSKLAKKSPVMLLELFLVIFILGNNCGMVWFLYFALLPLMTNMLLKCGYEKGDRFNYFFLGGCLMAGQIGMGIFPFRGWSLMTAGTMMQLSKTAIPYGVYILLMVLLILLLMITYPILMKLCGCKFDKLANIDVEEAFPNVQSGDKATQHQSLAIWSTVIFIAVTIIMSTMAGKVALLGIMNTQIGVVGLMVLLWIFVIAFRMKNGKPVLDMKEAAGSFQWDMLMLIAVALLISSVLTSEETGISAWLSGVLIPVFAGKSQFLFLFILALVTIILTNVGNNIAVCFVMINIVCAMYNNGFDVNITAAALIIAVSSVFTAFLTPAASLPGALLHASPCLTAQSIYKWTCVLMLYGTLLLMIIVIPYVLMS